MSKSNIILEPRLVAVDSHTLSHVDDHIQSYSEECTHLGYALGHLMNEFRETDPQTYGLLKTVQSAIFRISVDAEKLSEGIMDDLISRQEIKVNDNA
ncbi:hypothetical protein [Psychrobacter sp. S1-30-MNA-CIBAN-0213]|uniref:hypothetical protein n=1 Tax=Psychrobacter sp. S1-30-MNA-CIBAN-0213 TaxID=3140456 RepID=UPI00331F68E1